MPVVRLRMSGDCWEGRRSSDWEIVAPSGLDFEERLRRLDARQYTMVTIAGEGEAHLALGGGGGQYVVYATFDNEVFWNLLRPEPASGTVLLTVGGQEGDFPAAQIVDLDQARSAGLAFLTSGRLDPTQRWARQ